MPRRSPFRPAWWLPGPHAQTLWAAFGRRLPKVPHRWEVFPLPDGDEVELAWVDRDLPAGTPTVIVLHGLAGDVESSHVAGLLAALDQAGFRAGCLHFRGCGRTPNRRAEGYHSGKTDDPRHVLGVLRQREEGPLAVVGFSLGANVTLKMLGEDGDQAVVDAAAAISPPLELAKCADRMERGFSRLYQAGLLRDLKQYVRRKDLPGGPAVDLERLEAVTSFRGFDDLVTAPIHGFDDSADYYAQASSRPYLPKITVPTLIIHAHDDPFFDRSVVPAADEIPACVTFELAPSGGHVGFVEGRVPFRGRYHVDERVPGFLKGVLAAR